LAVETLRHSDIIEEQKKLREKRFLVPEARSSEQTPNKWSFQTLRQLRRLWPQHLKCFQISEGPKGLLAAKKLE
jgi:hypothetical protein